ncbi:tripartite tricarboxylate transporter TctB family protein [Psychromarinibacter sp. C21-152]|uniref:Tripartite tricarboxylate transporter TctB family protein n=1 Tax=Psychromarinibacter sediminicola TaxID=3033385 RepID=A0AAE3NX05_9RHOB|nr:tripartite tricarboxylate transporter TctB family protein [Psychromarinibacter sediminicola]MDF0603224.1 tripartite tricarboxylate transporter TctB family protein [Psychromarinibacter sediminicola]
MRMATADRVTAVVLFVVGLAMAIGGWTMDRLEVRNIHPASIPGLVPIILGVLLAICAVLLWYSTTKDPERGTREFMADGSWLRLALTGVSCVVYALVLVGWLPFFWATAVFVSVFALIFTWPERAEQKARALAIGGALVLGFAVAFGVSILFEQAFLVRLP